MKPTNPFVRPMLTDLYQITMAYAYWKSGRHEDDAVFDLFFRRNPFRGEFTIFAGLEEVLRFVSSFGFSAKEVRYLAQNLPGCDPAFFDWLRSVDCSRVRIISVPEGTVVFPRIPLVRVEGPLGVCQLLETTLLTLVNYPSLVTTNAARYRRAAGPDAVLLEFGLRRAQGPDGGMSASRYSYVGGFDATSNVLAGQLFGIPIRGTHAHAFVSSFSGFEDLTDHDITDAAGVRQDLVARVRVFRSALGTGNTNEGELAAFISYAQAFPRGFLALVDTYDTLASGVPNFLCVALALNSFGYTPLGIRLDSGDLAYLSKETRQMFREAGERFAVDFNTLTIVASNEVDEETLHSLNAQGHEIDAFGIGTHLVTCQSQPALGCVYKLVAVNNRPRIKLSNEPGKTTIPGRKAAYRLLGETGLAILDVMTLADEQPPAAGMRMLCRHPFEETKRAYVTPSAVMPLHRCVWDGTLTPFPSLEAIRGHVADSFVLFRDDHLRALNATPYKVAVSEELYRFVHDLWLEHAPITELR